MTAPSPFHEGELEAQRRTGEAEAAAANSPMIGDRILSGALRFLREQAMAVVASRDPRGRLWASMLFGQPGFLDPDPGRKAITVHLQPELRGRRDPLWSNLGSDLESNLEGGSQGGLPDDPCVDARLDPKIGMLVIDLRTRRRIRINGHLSAFGEKALRVEVEESFANCPKYIQRRELALSPAPECGGADANDCHATQFGPLEEELLRRADTLFLATAHPERGLDASHRGGDPGFVEVVDERTLRIPDYAGNSMFNSIGNLLVDPRAGLVVPDFERRQTLQMTGRIEVEWKQPTQGETGRALLFHLEELRLASLPAAVQAHFVDSSPWNPPVVSDGERFAVKRTYEAFVRSS